MNKPLPYNLLQETDRLQDLEHNTYVHYGFSHASYQNIRNPVSERHIIQPSLTAKFDPNTTSSLSENSIKTPLSSFTSHPPKHENPNLPTSSPRFINPTNIKRQKKGHSTTEKQAESVPLSPSYDESPLSAGCVWSSTNWSCTYDCVIMSIVYSFLFFNDDVKLKWSHQTPLTSLLTPLILRLISSHENIMSFNSFNHV